jgi:transcriptional regulator with XRE-family HTH domain
MAEIGATLREARMRARIDVSEIEAKTKIRAKYLRALENEEWSLLPGPTFVKSFLRTYAQALGLDGKALVEEYRLNHERPNDLYEPIASQPRRRPGGRPGASRGYIAAVGAVMAVIIVLIVLLATGGSSGPKTATKTRSAHPAHHHSGAAARPAPRPSPIVALSLKPKAVVYVCLLGDGGRKLIGGEELQPGESTATFHARRFLLTLGNSSVTMYVDGRPRSVPPSSEAIGYSITKARGRQPLAPAELPTCR